MTFNPIILKEHDGGPVVFDGVASGGGGGGSLTVTTPDNSVTPVTELIFTSGDVVSLGGGRARLTPTPSLNTVPVSSAQILDLANTPVTLIPGVPGFVTIVTALGVVYLAGVTPYTVVPASALGVETPPSVANWGNGVNQAAFIDQATDQVFSDTAMAVTQVSPLADADGVDVILTASVNPTLGNGTLLVSLSYFLAPTV